MIYILYSSDYELFFGGNYYSESEVLINSTENVLSVCEDIGVPITLFCDLPCLWRYRELGYTQFPDSVDAQLKSTIFRGHDVQAHIHPHWLETEIVHNEEGISKYNFDMSKFLIGNWIPEGGTALKDFCTDLFKRAKIYLEELLCPVNPSYRCIAFRAGGYGIQPNTRYILEALIATGYLIDSSIVPGMIFYSNVNCIDFSEVPKKGNYFIKPNLGLNEASEGGIFEIPVLALRQGEASWILAKYFLLRVIRFFLNQVKRTRKKNKKQLGYIIQSTSPAEKRETFLKRIFDQVRIIKQGCFTMELSPNVNMMVDATRYYINRYGNCKKDLYFSVSCHSKSAYPELLAALKNFHCRLKAIYGNRIKAITFLEAGRHLNSRWR